MKNHYEIIKEVVSLSLNNAVDAGIYDQRKVSVFIMHYFEGKGLKDIAAELNISTSRVSQLLVFMERTIRYSIFMPKREYFNSLERLEKAKSEINATSKLKKEFRHDLAMLIKTTKTKSFGL
jgi:DNA-binding transcriptional regulator LsrR (DeoR family)